MTDNIIITPEGKAPITKVGSLKVVNLEGGVEGVMLADWGFDFSGGVKMTDSKEVDGVHTAYIGGYTMQELKEIYARRAEWGVL